MFICLMIKAKLKRKLKFRGPNTNARQQIYLTDAFTFIGATQNHAQEALASNVLVSFLKEYNNVNRIQESFLSFFGVLKRLIETAENTFKAGKQREQTFKTDIWQEECMEVCSFLTKGKAANERTKEQWILITRANPVSKERLQSHYLMRQKLEQRIKFNEEWIDRAKIKL